jgi:hypothetical protein
MKTIKVYVKNKPNPMILDFSDDSVILAPSVVDKVAEYVQGLPPFSFEGVSSSRIPIVVSGLIREHFRTNSITEETK